MRHTVAAAIAQFAAAPTRTACALMSSSRTAERRAARGGASRTRTASAPSARLRFVRGLRRAASRPSGPPPRPSPRPPRALAAIRAHEASPTCDENFLSGLRAELRSLVGAQTARNNEIRAALGLSTVEAAPPGEPRPPPPPPFPSPAPPPCVPVGAQCGGSTWSGHTSCCRTASNAETVCRWYSDAFSGCREVGQQ